MRKSEFVAAVAKEAGMSQRDTEKVIDTESGDCQDLC